MSPSEVDLALANILGEDYEAGAATHIGKALKLAVTLERQGFDFRLVDTLPKNPDQSLWKAEFTKDGERHENQSPSAPLAVCLAALKALSHGAAV
jgi:hypothetical protein